MSLTDLFSCKGKTAVVTGGAGALYGHCITEALCEAGARVIVASRNRQSFLDNCSRLAEQYPVFFESFDLSDAVSARDLCRNVEAKYGPVDILVNSAVSPPLGGTLWDGNAENWYSAMGGNGATILLLCQGFGNAMKQRGSGVILNIASIWGVVAPDYTAYDDAQMSPNPIAYGFLKGGLLMLTRSLASLLGPYGIRVNAIVPGGVADETDPPAYREVYVKKVPLGRWSQPEDIKGAVVYLCSDASSYVTGAAIPVDGGYTIR